MIAAQTCGDQLVEKEISREIGRYGEAPGEVWRCIERIAEAKPLQAFIN